MSGEAGFRAKGKVAIRAFLGGEVKTIEVPCEGTPPLVINHPNLNGEGGFSLTHVDTGLAVTNGLTLKMARRLRRELLSLSLPWSEIARDESGNVVTLPERIQTVVPPLVRAARLGTLSL